MTDFDWQNATCVGSPFEQQYNVRTGIWRHRLALFPPESLRQLHPEDGWSRGPAPDAKEAELS